MVAVFSSLRAARFALNSSQTKTLRLARLFSSTSSRLTINKVYPSADAAIDDLESNSTILCGGFGLSGVPDTLINALRDRPEKKGFTAVSNNAGVEGGGLGQLLQTKQVSKMIASYVGENKTFESMYLKGELDLELTPQGTLAERCRAGGAGIPAFYTPTAFATLIQTGEMAVRYNPDGSIAQKSKPREVREFNGIKYIMEEAIRGDYALVKAYKADKHGNCIFRLSANNFNGAMARNARVTIVEAEHIVEPGELDPASIHVPGIYVDRVIQSTAEKQIEKYTFAKDPEEQLQSDVGGDALAKREKIVRRAAKEFKNGMYANLGIGIPMLAPNFLAPGVSVTLQSGILPLERANEENGILGLGPYPKKGQEDPDLINAGKETVTLNPGAAVFGSEESFGMIRSGKINLTMLGAMQVNMYGDLANWFLPGKVKGMGGAMDLVSQPHRTKVVVTMEHVDKKGRPKIVKDCAFPLTGFRCVSRIITELAVFDVDHDKGLTLIEKSKDTTVEEIKSKTGAPFEVASNLKDMED